MNGLKRAEYRRMPPLTETDFTTALHRVAAPDVKLKLASAD
jgi:hypothetical protein